MLKNHGDERSVGRNTAGATQIVFGAFVMAASAACLSTGAQAQQSSQQSSQQSYCLQSTQSQSSQSSYYTYSQPYCPTASQGIGGQVSAAVGSAGVRATRNFTETLNDRNEAAATGGQQSGAPAGVSQYAPSPAAFQARFPIVVATAAPPPPYRVFATGFGGGFNNSAVVSQSGNYYGGLVGIDYRINPTFLVGAAAGGSSSNVSVGGTANGQVSGFNGSIYAIASMGPFYGQSLTTLSAFSNSSTRNVAAAGGIPFSVEHASFGSFEVRERAEFGRTYVLGQYNGATVKITPFVALEIAQLHLNGHNEFNTNGAGNLAGIATPGQDVNDIPGFVGMRLEASYDVGNGMVFTPIVRLAYVHQFADANFAAATFLASGTSSFAPNGTLLGRNSAQTKVGFELNMGHGTVIFTNFDGLFSSADQLYGGRAGVRYSF